MVGITVIVRRTLPNKTFAGCSHGLTPRASPQCKGGSLCLTGYNRHATKPR